MGKKIARSNVMFLFAVTCLFNVAMANDEYHGPHTLGPVQFGLNIWTDAEPFFEKYGKGVAYEGKFPRYYYVTEKKEYVYISRYHGENRPIQTIEVSSLPTEESNYGSPKQPFGRLVTEDGIGLGSSYDDVLVIYGTPDRVRKVTEMDWKPVPNSWIGKYGGDLLFVEYLSGDDACDSAVFFVANNIVVSISVSVSC